MAKKRKAAEITIDINANVARLSKDMNRAVGELDKLQRKVAGVQKILTASFALDLGKTLIPAVRDISTYIGGLAKKGEEIQGVSAAFQQLGGSAEQLNQAKAALFGTVSALDLMKVANEGLLKQVPGVADNFAKIAELGGKIASSLGTDAKGAIEQIISALASGKEKQLEALKVNIDTTKAYKSYADAIGVASDKLDENQKKEAVQIEFYKNLQATIDSLPAAADSVANAQDAMNVAFEEGVGQLGAAINSNDELRAAYRQLAETLDDVDWVALGTAASQFFSTVLQAASTALPAIIQYIEDVNRGFQYLFGTGLQAQADASSTKIRELQGELANLDERVKNNAFQGKAAKWVGLGWSDEAITAEKKRLNDAIAAEQQVFTGLKTKIDAQAETAKGAAGATKQLSSEVGALNGVVVPAIKNTGQSAEALKEQAKAAQQAAKEIDRINTAWRKYQLAAEQDKISQADISSLTESQYTELKTRMQGAVRQGFYEEWKDKIKLGGKDYAEVLIAAEQKVAEESDRLDKERAAKRKQQEQDLQRIRQQGLNDMYRGADQLSQQLGVDIGGILDQLNKNFGKQMSDTMQSIAESIGMTGDTAGASLSSYIGTGLQVVGTAIAAKDKDRATKSNQGTGEAVGSAIGTGIGAAVGGAAGAELGRQLGQVIGGFIGGAFKWGPQNDQTKSRHVFANWLEEQLKQLNSVAFFDKTGKFQSINGNSLNFVEGDSSRFNNPGWAEQMNSWGGKATETFLGLGNALKGVLGITDKVGSQIGFLLGENLAANIDNARLFVYELGLSIEDLSDALLKMAKNGEITWQEYASNIAGLGEAFKPGLQGINDMKGAVDELYGSGGRGMAALKSIKDIAVEAIEGGAKSIDDLRQQLVNGGMSAEDADKVVAQLKAAGIKTLEEVKNLSEAQLGQIVAGIGNSVDAINKKWQEVGKTLDKLKWDMDNLPKEKEIKITFKGVYDKNMQQASDAGLLKNNEEIQPVNPPNTKQNNGNVTKRQTSAAMSLAAQTGKVQANAFSISIDARGAEAGVEQKIHEVIHNYRDAIAGQAASIVMDNQQRGY